MILLVCFPSVLIGVFLSCRLVSYVCASTIDWNIFTLTHRQFLLKLLEKIHTALRILGNLSMVVLSECTATGWKRPTIKTELLYLNICPETTGKQKHSIDTPRTTYKWYSALLQNTIRWFNMVIFIILIGLFDNVIVDWVPMFMSSGTWQYVYCVYLFVYYGGKLIINIIYTSTTILRLY